ncbi:thiolase family protein [Dasania sp. GY-MA-18]|uniref:Thiolase family protein n=1 Tax=Dasania phycosphaerae TaxID=2950436 RepID=A0A9J6RHU1_9GAMM|nr:MULTISPECIES: thiolase family protein [Dasania]MCR8921347.1 thiolase family protein [Dasania sp. GY-MA-18]MCZ0863775.1 thiolase family protein [Dasania phycosphaerae]MCZ0867503.1 thiolase family protein [Dasania phycosphaerae]
MSNKHNIVIVAAKRTPMGGLQGELANIPATELGAVAIKAALVQAAVSHIDEVYMGNVVSAGLKQAPARQASLKAGLDTSIPCTTISKVCGSGMKAIMIGRDQIAASNAEVIVAGGMENMSATPYLLPKARQGLRLGHGEVLDSLLLDGLEDAETGGLMGHFGQSTADNYNISRTAMDAYAVESLKRAQAAAQQQLMQDEIAPVSLATRNGEHIIALDEQPGKAQPEKIPQLKPAFKKGGSITAANASSISDGAAALILMRESHALEQGHKPLARLIAQATHAQAPSEFCLAPIGAINQVLDQAGWSSHDVDLWEINEAFAVVTLLAMQQLGLDHRKVNIHGGACALGHPLGASGARIVVTLIYALKRMGLKKGVASLCIGGGEATAIALEVL